MTNDMRIKAQQAKDLLNNKAFVEAMGRVRETQIDTFLSSAKSDVEMRERAHSIVLAGAISMICAAITDFEMLEQK